MYKVWISLCINVENEWVIFREMKQGGKDEACIGILNNFYEDGVKWHDVECRHKKPIICQDSDELLDFIFGPEK